MSRFSMRLRSPILTALALASLPVAARAEGAEASPPASTEEPPAGSGRPIAGSWGLSYTSAWGSLSTQLGFEVVGGPETAPVYEGGLRTNAVTLHNRSGMLRAIMSGIGSAGAEAGRRRDEANASGGYYHRLSPGLPPVVPGGDTRLTFTWGSNETWRHWSIAYTDSTEPRQIGNLPLAWSIEARVKFGSFHNFKWLEEDSISLISLLQVGPVIYFAPRVSNAVAPLVSLGARIDPIFKPIVSLAVGEGTPALDTTVYLRAEAFALRFLMVGGELSYSRGFTMSGKSSEKAAAITAGVFLP